MHDWANYVRQFYALSRERQQAEWQRLDDDQRRQFIAVQASAGQRRSDSPGSGSPAGGVKAAAIGCSVIVVLGAIMFALAIASQDLEERRAAAVAAEAAHRQEEKAAAERQKAIDYFLNHRKEILTQVEASIAQGELERAKEVASAYLSVGDQELIEDCRIS